MSRRTREQRRKLLSGHAEPHFNTEGGCLCECSRCVGLRRSEGHTTIRYNQVCICPACSEECSAFKLELGEPLTREPDYHQCGVFGEEVEQLRNALRHIHDLAVRDNVTGTLAAALNLGELVNR